MPSAASNAPNDSESAGGTIRRARRSDADALGELWLELLQTQADLDERMGVSDDALERWKNDFPMWIEDDTRRIFVAEADEEAGSDEAQAIQGFVSAHRWGPAPVYRDQPEIFMDEIYVRPEARRQGLGSRLVAAVTDWADETEAHRIRLRVLNANEEGRAFWSAIDAEPLSHTLTIERPQAGNSEEGEEESKGSKKIGF